MNSLSISGRIWSGFLSRVNYRSSTKEVKISNRTPQSNNGSNNRPYNCHYPVGRVPLRFLQPPKGKVRPAFLIHWGILW